MDMEQTTERLIAADTEVATEVVAAPEPPVEPTPTPIREVAQFGRHVHFETAELCLVEVCSGGTQWNVVMDPMKPPPTPIIEKGPPGETEEELKARLARKNDEVRDKVMKKYNLMPLTGAYILCTEKLISQLGLLALERSHGGRWFMIESRASFPDASHVGRLPWTARTS
jgi:hypothetical protein